LWLTVYIETLAHVKKLRGDAIKYVGEDQLIYTKVQIPSLSMFKD